MKYFKHPEYFLRPSEYEINERLLGSREADGELKSLPHQPKSPQLPCFWQIVHFRKSILILRKY